MSIRLRLTLLYSAILAVTLSGFSFASYVTVAHDGYNRLVDTLRSKAERIVTDATFRLDDIKTLAHLFAGPEIYVQTRDASGVIVDRSVNLGENVLPLEGWRAAGPPGSTAWVEIAWIEGERRLLYNQPLVDGGTAIGLLQISNSLAARDRSLGNLMQVLVVGNVIVVLAAVGMGWLLAGIGLRPIFRLAQTVLAIGHTQDFARRVNYAGPDDEIGQLANTFDQMMAQLEAAHRQTEQALHAQRRFVADASHELRTPLTTIRGNLDLLRREPPIRKSDHRAVLSDLVEETERLSRMVNDLLVLARADVEPPQWQEPVRLQPLLESVQRQIGHLAPMRSVCFDYDFPPLDRPVIVLGHEDALRQVLLILLDNAVKHTPPSARITVQAVIVDAHVEIRVCDTGPGIPPDELPRIFDRFHVVDTIRTTNSTGLGLAIARALIDSQNGQITVTSSAEYGTTFKVTLICQKQLE